MLCNIADLIVEVPEAGGLASRCKDYLWDGNSHADIVIQEKLYRSKKYDPRVGNNMVAYMESASQFYGRLVEFGGFYLHSSVVVLDGNAYLFSGPSGAGKSTHTRLWQQVFGTDARVINDDKPALRRINGIWYAYGTPWCGKDGINLNEKAPIAGVCFLKKAKENKIRRLSASEAMQRIMSQTIYKFQTAQTLDLFLGHLEQFLRDIPVYELDNLPEAAAVQLSYGQMCPNKLERKQ